MFEPLNASAYLSQLAPRISVPGYSFSSEPQKQTISMPGEGDLPVTSFFYARHHFRIYISRATVEFYRGAVIPSELVAGERQLYARILETNAFSVRRWLATSEGWNDDDQPFVNTVAEGNSADTFPLLRV
jgi:hypothetical protein